MPERWHGTAGGYTNHHCRCNGCRAAWVAFMTAYRDRLRARSYIPPQVHGSLNGYTNYRCRCSACRATKRAYDQTHSAEAVGA